MPVGYTRNSRRIYRHDSTDLSKYCLALVMTHLRIYGQRLVWPSNSRLAIIYSNLIVVQIIAGENYIESFSEKYGTIERITYSQYSPSKYDSSFYFNQMQIYRFRIHWLIVKNLRCYKIFHKYQCLKKRNFNFHNFFHFNIETIIISIETQKFTSHCEY